jgi:hypothetical protein
MPKNKISEFSSTPANNTDIGGIDIAEGCAPSGINNAIRELMAQLKDQQAGTDADSFTVGGNLIVTGTSTFTGIPSAPTAAAGTSTTQVATTEFLRTMYPIGSIYTSTVATNPNTLFGFGTWVAFGAGRVMVGVGGAFSAGATGGSADAVVVSHTHTFSGNALPTHSHTVPLRGIYTATNGNYGGDAGASTFTPTTSAVSAGTPTGTNTTEGVSGTNANLPPYVVVYMWNRTA